MRQIVSLVPLWLLVLVSLAMAQIDSIGLPQTGQTTCYDTNGAAIDCAGTGQDGDIRAGVAWPQQRFDDNGNGTMTDSLTGLIWMQNAHCFDTRVWSQAGHPALLLIFNPSCVNDDSSVEDWRLPNINELESLL